ncbi:unnamed protein product, partial [Ectocarpus fasciculatus]
CKIQPLPIYPESGSYANEYVEEAKGRSFENFHGLQMEEETVWLEGEGISVFIRQLPLDTTSRYFKKVRKQYINKGIAESQNVLWLPVPNRVYGEYQMVRDEMEKAYRLYVFPYQGYLFTVGIQGYNLKDTVRWDNWVTAISQEGIPEYVITTNNPSTVDFVGRMLEISPGCVWVEPHHIQCLGKGQISWSLHATAESARKSIEQQIYYTKTYRQAELLKEEEVPFLFEDVPVSAHKMTYRIKMPRFLLGGSNTLIIYYVNTEVRGHHLHCVMSFYDIDARPGGLAPLIQKVMKPL